MKIATPLSLKKVTSSFPAAPFQKLRSCQAPPFLKIWLEVQPPSSRKGGWGGGRGVCTLCVQTRFGEKKATFNVFVIFYHLMNCKIIFSWLIVSGCQIAVFCCFCILSEVFSHFKLIYDLIKKNPKNTPAFGVEGGKGSES